MKKVLSFVAVAAFVFSLSSCKKSGECVCENPFGDDITTTYEDLDGDEYDALETSCNASGICSWNEL